MFEDVDIQPFVMSFNHFIPLVSQISPKSYIIVTREVLRISYKDKNLLIGTTNNTEPVPYKTERTKYG